ncbi:MAG TPA: DUF6531 domain-containing protein [Solirubrobacterales bacterium]
MRWLVVFALILLAAMATPVLADEPIEGPDFSQIEQEELERAEWLQGPEAAQQREESRTAYTSLTANESQDLLLQAFPTQLKALNADPARVLSELEVEEPLGTFGALVAPEEGQAGEGKEETEGESEEEAEGEEEVEIVESEEGAGEIVESSVPVESDLGGGGEQPVDLTLEQAGEGYEPENPLTEVSFPGSTEGAIHLTDGLEVEMAASNDREAEYLGEMNLFYPATETTTDTLVAPLAGGVEIFEQLRSPDSPEQFRFNMGLPAEATLQGREDGGAEVLVGAEEVIAEVPPPSAVDAQGVPVSVAMSVEEGSLVLNVAHRSMDVAYPILVDPTIQEEEAQHIKVESPSFGSGDWHSISSAEYGLNNGGSFLEARANNNHTFAANTNGKWSYTAPGETAFIQQAAFSGVDFHGCQRQPHGYLALYNPSAGWYAGNLQFYVENGSGGVKSGSYSIVGGYGYRDALIGIGTAEKSVKTTCVAELKVHGATMTEADPENPTIDSVSGIPSSGAWFDPAKVGNATIVATDPGFGIRNISMFDGQVTTKLSQQPCTGVSGNRCQRQVSWQSFPPYFEGEQTLKVTAEDPLAKTTTWSLPTKVDMHLPEVDLGGQFAYATDEAGLKGEQNEASENKLSLPTYNLHIEATDGNPSGTSREFQSGVKNIEILLDGKPQEVPWEPQPCTKTVESGPPGHLRVHTVASANCSMTEDYQVSLVGLAADKHKLAVRVTDQVGHARARPIEFEYIPATGMSDEYVMQHFPLPDGKEGQSEEEAGRPELAVNVMNGNVVYHQRDVEVSGPNVDLDLDRYYNSQLPAEESSEWGEGWTLAQTPKLEVETAPKEEKDDKAAIRQRGGLIERAVTLPNDLGAHHFDSRLQAVVTKQDSGRYTLTDASGHTDNTYAFNDAGKATELKTSGFAKVEYDYQDGDLSEVAVHDPTIFSGTLEEGPQKPSEFEAPAYVDSFGGETSGPGRLSSPNAVAIDPDGHLWVADAGHRRVQEFDSSGAFVNEFGVAGPENGQFIEPRAVAVDPNGMIWVADKNMSWIQKFNPEGKFLDAFGGYGTANGKFTALEGIAFDSEGHLWTLDGGKTKPRVQEFSSTGTYIRQFGSAGTADGQFKEPQGMAIDPEGHIWVADTGNSRIQEFGSTGTFIRKFGSVGSGNGQLNAPTALSLDAEGNVWVTDTKNNRIVQFSGEGAYLSQFGTAGANDGQFSEPRGIAIDASGDAWIADTANNRVQEIAAGEFLRTFGGESSAGGNLSSPYGVTADSKGNVWVADTAHNRIQEFSSTGQFILQFGAKGSTAGLFSEPHDVAVDAEGHVWVADTGNSRVQEFDSKGSFIRQLGSTKGCANGNFNEVWGVVVDSAGHLWTVDSATTCSRVQEFSSAGTFIRKFGTYGTAYNQFLRPRGIAADPSGNVWVADTGNNRLAEYTGEGKFVRAVGSLGSGNGQFRYPAALAADPEGNIWVADAENNRIEELGSEGGYLAQFGTPGNEDGQLDYPNGIDIDAKGNIWIADTSNDRIQEIAATEFVRKFGGENSGIGQLLSPYDLATDSEGNVWIADSVHYRLQEFDPHGEPLRQVSTFGEGIYSAPVGVGTDANDDLWVAEGQGRVLELGPKGSVVRRFGSSGTENGQFSSLQDVAADPDGHVWTIERDPPRVQEFTAEGKFLSSFGVKGTESGQLYEPTAIATDSQGNVWIADTANNRIEEFTPAGKYLRKFGSFGFTSGHFYSPEGLSIDAKDNVWVADTYNHRVQIFNSVGTYLGQFGTPGNNYGQLAHPRGVATDAEGHVWVADRDNDRAQKWQIPQYVFAHDAVYDSSLATEGSAAGELQHPGDVAVDPAGNLWVADTKNNRIEQFDAQGEFVQTFGYKVNKTKVEAKGSEAETNVCTASSDDECQAGVPGLAGGRMRLPSALALDAEGNVWVVDTGNSRIMEFSDAGEYLAQVGTEGQAEGELAMPEGIAIDSHGDLWVSDTYQGRVQVFDRSGDLIKIVGSHGELSEPVGIDVGPTGHVWVADWQRDRVVEFDRDGNYVRAFGSSGSANGQFGHPDGLAVDERGEIWVADENNHVQAFTEKGEFIAQFGVKGTGDGQFKLEYPIGIATDSKGNLWATDSKNDRIQHWGVFNDVPANEAGIGEDAPEIQVEESQEGLVEGVEGDEAGEISYEHEGDLLSAVEGPEGGTDYEYVEVGDVELLSKVTLPNGNWAEVSYDSLGRAEAVSVSIAGKTKTTHFGYSDVPRRTVVEPEGEPPVTYDIGPDGSVLKWSDAVEPPEIEALSGTLYYERGEVHPEPIGAGDQNLDISAHSYFGIASIQLVANGNQLVTEKTCEQNYAELGTECVHEEKEFVTEAEDWAPGIAQFEVIVTDSLGHSTSQRFWDNIPYVPPPDPEVPEPPRFKDVLKFREEFGLDLDLKGNERAINERIFKLIGDWHDPSTSEGEVARASWGRWGVPLRAVDVAELEYREWFYNLDAERIDQWVEETKPSSFAGYYIDHAAGGIMHIGFLDNQAERLANLEASLSLVAGERLQVYLSAPTASYLSVRETSESLSNIIKANASLRDMIVDVEEDEAGKAVRVRTSNVAQVETVLDQLFGSSAPINVEYDSGNSSLLSGRFRNKGRMRAGDALFTQRYTANYPQVHRGNSMCTAGFGAKEKADEVRSQPVWRLFVLTAGHCNGVNSVYEDVVYRSTDSDLGNESSWTELGRVTRNALRHLDPVNTDAEAIRVLDDGIVPQGIYGWNGELIPTEQAGTARVGDTLCFSGATSQVPHCGHIVGRSVHSTAGQDGHARGGYWVKFDHPALHGDSGGPVWMPGSKDKPRRSIGLVTADRSNGRETLIEPLLHPPNLAPGQVVGILNNQYLAPLSLKLGE